MATVLSGMAQTSFRVQAPDRVVQGQKFAVTYRFSNGSDPADLRVPAIGGCRVLYGPSEATRQSYQIINGVSSSSRSVDYTYYYLAETPGQYTVGEATIKDGSKRYSTRPFKLTIVAGQPDNAQQGGAGGGRPDVNIDDISTQSSDRTVKSNDVIVRIILSRSKVYEQEAIDCTIKLYTKYNISSFRPTLQPSFDGFLIEDLDVTPSLNEVETLNGQSYRTAVLKHCIIFPQKSGKLTINSGNYDISVVQFEQIDMGLFSMRNPTERQIQVTSNTATVDVMALPQPQPADFSGAVGQFTIDSRLVGNTFRTNDPATLITTISGTGNIKYMKEPAIDFPSEFEQYTPKSETETQARGSNVSGTMTVEYTFVPTTVGNFKIGADKFVYFDPSTARYVTLDVPGYDIHVAQGLSAPSQSERKDIEAKNTDILHIHQGDKHLARTHEPIADTLWYWMLYVGALLLLVVAITLYGKHARAMADISGRKMARANKMARQRLRMARKMLDQKQTDKFHDELLKALWGYMGDKLLMPASQLTRDNVATALTDRYGEAGQTAADHLIEVIDQCEMARYAPAAAEEPEQLYTHAADTIDEIEKLKPAKKA